MKRPPISVLCGSVRFGDAYREANTWLTEHGHIVLSVAPNHLAPNPRVNDDLKQMLDELHLQKIDLADQVVLIGVDRHIGESTRSEIQYAQEHGKRILQWPSFQKWSGE